MDTRGEAEGGMNREIGIDVYTLLMGVLIRVTHVQLFRTPWTAAHQSSLSMRLCRREYWSRLPFPPPEDLSDPGIRPTSPALAGRFFTTESPWKPVYI